MFNAICIRFSNEESRCGYGDGFAVDSGAVVTWNQSYQTERRISDEIRQVQLRFRAQASGAPGFRAGPAHGASARDTKRAARRSVLRRGNNRCESAVGSDSE